MDCDKYRSTPKHSQCSAVCEKSFADGRKSFLSPEIHQIRSPFSSPKANSHARGYEITEKNSLFPPISRSSSQCSGSTEWTHRGDGSLPLKATHSELSWGSTRLRRSEKRTLQIKNTSDRKILLRAIITGPGFQLYSVEHQRAPEVLTLQSQECRTITVDFCPTIIGPAVGVLSFHPPNDLHAQRIVSLYGYGGEASVKIEGIQKGPGGPYLELGNACHLGRPLEKSFSLYNKGNLPAFARIDIDRKSLDQALLASVVYVHPRRTVISPNSYAHIKVVFKPGRQEISKILQKQVEVLSVTNLHILWGDEPTRHRIRRNIAMVKSKEVNDPKLEAMTHICNPFGEEEELAGLDLFAEHLFDTIHELFLTFREYELVLTIDRSLDDTMLDLSMADEEFGALFKTMYATAEGNPSARLPVSNNCQLSPPGESGTQALGILKRESGESWSVRPTALEFQASVERMKQFVIKSNFYTSQYFELNCNYRQLFRLSPSEGHIRPGQEVVVTASLQHVNSTGLQQQNIFFVVYIENEKISVPVSIYNGKI
ncbi:uncharacterized protein LOC131214347 [Anopheles bellator]|uniref:uncharacterized protein LOC131214346 n=1 Tax=Anopheles bellator TaxID=139047 RepID=UPI0026485ACD|nr:uncharacterized protein LOC131214346 [Anopheles bellator]XP_058064711.1 uncharacterized protein LOC131214347 [Anopheles bellator]